MDVFKKASFWEKKKPFYKRLDFWLIIIIIAGTIAMIFSTQKSDNLITANPTAEASEKQVQEILMNFGDKVIIDGVSYQIKKFDKEAAIPRTAIVAGGVFYLVRFEMVNTNEAVTTPAVPIMWITSSDGKDLFAARKDLEARFKSTMIGNEALESNIPIERVRIFDVSPGMKNLQLLIDTGDTKYYIPLSKK